MARKKVQLRVLGTSVTLTESIRLRAEHDLGIPIQFEVMDGLDAQQQAVVHPERFDLYDQWFHSNDFLWPTGSLQPIELKRIENWTEVNELPKLGRIQPRAPLGSGCNPCSRLYVQPDGDLGDCPSALISMLPLTHNADSFVYLPESMPKLFTRRPESWSWLVDPAVSGKVALQADAAIGALDVAMALQASGEAHFKDVGNLTIEEIDQLVEILKAKRQSGQFSGFWKNFADSARMMIHHGVTIQSHWSPAAQHYHEAGLDFRLAAPIEGYRAWYGGLSIFSHVYGEVLDAAYAFLNWWLSGWPGAAMARQGYYISNPERSRPYMTGAEWDYWYEGKPAAIDLPGINGRPMIAQGSVRDGGSYEQRMSSIAVWNTVMDEHNYLVRKCSELLQNQ